MSSMIKFKERHLFVIFYEGLRGDNFNRNKKQIAMKPHANNNARNKSMEMLSATAIVVLYHSIRVQDISVNTIDT